MPQATPTPRGVAVRAGFASAPGRHASGGLASVARRLGASAILHEEGAAAVLAPVATPRGAIAKPMRLALIERVRRELADGTYDLDDKVDLALDCVAVALEARA